LNGNRHIVTQSLAIIDFLERAFPGVGDSTSLFRSGDIEAQAFALSFSEIINSGIQPLQNLDTCSQISKGSGGSMNGRAFGKTMIEKGLSSLEKLVFDRWLSSGFDISSHSSTETNSNLFFVLGVSSSAFPSPFGPSIADACLIPQLYNARRFEVDVSKYPCLLLIESHCTKEAAFIEAFPDKQPDAEQLLPPPQPLAAAAAKAGDIDEKSPKKAKH
jgi:glutathione S-transferase